jgi:hypothetical protein
MYGYTIEPSEVPEATEAQANAVFEQIKIQFKEYITPDYAPKLVKDWDYLESGPKAWAVVWEQGPHEWPYSVPTFPAPEASVWAEAVNTWAVAIYPV